MLYHISALIAEFRTHMVLKSFSKSTVKTYCQIVDCFMKDCQIKYPHDQLNPGIIG